MRARVHNFCERNVPITIGTNIASIGAQRHLAKASDKLSTVSERLSSGQRINRASDDAAGLAISSSLNADIRVFNQAIRNVNDGISALNIADQAVANLSDIVTRQTELAAQSANGIYSATQRAELDREAQALRQEYSRIVATTQFNGIKLLDGSSNGLNLQAGFGANGVISAKIFGQAAALVDNGTVTNTTINLPDSGGPTSSAYLLGDLNADGISDIVSLTFSVDADFQGGSFYFKAFLGSSSGTFTENAGFRQSYSAPGEEFSFTFISAHIFDYTSDGQLDVRFRYLAASDLGSINVNEREEVANLTTGGVFSMDLGLNDNLLPSGNNTTAGGSSIADFNGDGINDNLTIGATGFTIGLHNTTLVAGASSSLDDLTQSSFSLTTQANARSALDTFDALATELSQNRGRIGAALSRIASAAAVLQAASTNSSAAQSRIISADIATESAELARFSILQNVGSAVLAQANKQPEITLKLLGA